MEILKNNEQELTDNRIGNRIVAFHIGKGGRFHNAGHTTFNGESEISAFTNDLFLRYENLKEVKKEIKAETKKDSTLREKLLDLLTSDEDLSFFEKLGFNLGEKIYFNESGNEVGLTEAEELTGVGRIEFDGDYDTDYTRYLEDCDDRELQLILDYEGYVGEDILDFCKEVLGIEDEQEVKDENFTN